MNNQSLPDQEEGSVKKFSFVLAAGLLSIGAACPIVIEDPTQPRPTPTPVDTPCPVVPTPTATTTIVPTGTTEPLPTVTTPSLIFDILKEPLITQSPTVCSKQTGKFQNIFSTARAKVATNFPKWYYTEQCIKDGTEPTTGRSYRDLYSLAVAYFIRDVGFDTIMDPNNKAEVVIRNGIGSFSEQFQTLEGGLSPFCDKVAIRILPCTSGCYKATCEPAWFTIIK